MTNPKVIEHNVETNEIIEREMTQEELEISLANDAHAQTWRESQETKEAEKQALYERLGITADEAKLLLS